MSHGSKIVDKVFNLIPIQRQDASQDFNFFCQTRNTSFYTYNMYLIFAFRICNWSFNLIKLDNRYERNNILMSVVFPLLFLVT